MLTVFHFCLFQVSAISSTHSATNDAHRKHAWVCRFDEISKCCYRVDVMDAGCPDSRRDEDERRDSWREANSRKRVARDSRPNWTPEWRIVAALVCEIQLGRVHRLARGYLPTSPARANASIVSAISVIDGQRSATRSYTVMALV